MKKLMVLMLVLLLAIAGCSNSDNSEEKTVKSNEEVKSNEIENSNSQNEEVNNNQLDKNKVKVKQNEKSNLSNSEISLATNLAYNFVLALADQNSDSISVLSNGNIDYDVKKGTFIYTNDKSVQKIASITRENLWEIRYEAPILKNEKTIEMKVNHVVAAEKKLTSYNLIINRIDIDSIVLNKVEITSNK